MMMSRKATRQGVRLHNRNLILRSLFNEEATSRATLSEVTGLSKPAVSSLVTDLIDEGFISEEGLGSSTESGGKRARILKFLPSARQVIGIEIQDDTIHAILTNLDSVSVARHYVEHHIENYDELLNLIAEVVNGLTAQLSSDLLCIGVGFPGLLDPYTGEIQYSAKFRWRDVPFARDLTELLGIPVYTANSTQLASKAQFAFDEIDRAVTGLATVKIDGSIGVGFVTREANIQFGGEIGYLSPLMVGPLQDHLSWGAVDALAQQLAGQHSSEAMRDGAKSYLRLQYLAYFGDAAAIELIDHLASMIAEIFAWLIAILHPNQISLTGKIADLGNDFLSLTIQKLGDLILPELIGNTTFSVDARTGLVALGAATNAVQRQLGLI